MDRLRTSLAQAQQESLMKERSKSRYLKVAELIEQRYCIIAQPGHGSSELLLAALEKEIIILKSEGVLTPNEFQQIFEK